MNKNITIYIDESGTLPDPKDKVVIVAAVGTSSTTQITKIIKSIKHSEIFVLVVEKAGKSIPDSPENFALLCWFILEDCLALHRHRKTRVIFDRHFHKLSDQNQFNTILTRLLGFQTEFSHKDSQKNPLINAADMVAGSLLWAQRRKSYQLAGNKAPVLNTKKCPNRCKHPSRHLVEPMLTQSFQKSMPTTQIKQLFNEGSAVRFGPATGTP